MLQFLLSKEDSERLREILASSIPDPAPAKGSVRVNWVLVGVLLVLVVGILVWVALAVA
jgi:hypothetical protein